MFTCILLKGNSTQITLHDVRQPLFSLNGRVKLPLLFLLSDSAIKQSLFVVHHYHFEGKLLSYALSWCICKFFPSKIIVATPQSTVVKSPSANPKRMTLSTRPTSKKFRTSRAKKVICLRSGAGNDQES